MEENQKRSPECTEILPELSEKLHKKLQEVRREIPQEDNKKKKKKKHKKTASSAFQIFREEEFACGEVDFSSDNQSEVRKKLESSGNRYRIEKLIATGGFGQVFLAEDKILKRKIVIKTLKEEFNKNDLVTSQFISEAKLCAQLSHPAIVPLYNLNTDSVDGLHISMQLVNGITLRTYLDRTLECFKKTLPSAHTYALQLKQRLSIFLRICEALSYCHDRKVIHNDLKPDNIMLANFGQVYVMDWGIATPEGTVSKEGVPGTVAYMAPEKLTSKVSTRKTDIFSLGMILNEIVTLRGHIEGETPTRIAEQICTGNFTPNSCIIPKYRIPAALKAIIEKARHPNPAERYDEVKDLAEDIRHYLFFEEIKARPDHLILKGFRYLVHHRLAAQIIIITALLVIAGTMFTSYYRRNVMVREFQKQTILNIGRQNETEKAAEMISHKLMLLQEQMRNLSSTIRYESDRATPPGIPKAPVRMAKDLDPETTTIPGLVHTAYYKNPVSLDYVAFYAFGAEDLSGKIQEQADYFSRIHSQMLSSMFMDTQNGSNAIRNDKNKLFHLRESLIRRMIFLIGKRIACVFPAMYDDVKSSTEFQSDYIQRQFRSGHRQLWSPPVRDSSGYSVISCWQTLFNTHGQTIGSMGFEISFKEILSSLRELIAKDTTDSAYAIVDSEDRVIYSDLSKNSRLVKTEQTKIKDSLSDTYFYRFPQILRKIRTPGSPQMFRTKISGENYRIHWTKISPVGWYLIRHCPEK